MEGVVRVDSSFGVSKVSLIEQERSGGRVRLWRHSGQRDQHAGRLRGSSELGLWMPKEGPSSPRVTRGRSQECALTCPPPLLRSQQKTELPVTENVQTIPPPYVVRTILVYSRPPCQPQFSLTEPMKVSEAQEREGYLQPAASWLDTRRNFLITRTGVPVDRFP